MFVLTSLVICIPTFRRNQELSELLDRLAGQTLPPAHEVAVRLLVIDNNPNGDAADVVEAARPITPLPLAYVHEMAPGVTHVRNRALEECASDDFLAFIDDDELPDTGWLETLWARRRETGATVVFGTVEATYADTAPAWIVAGDFHSKRIAVDGFRHKPGATDNCLIDLAIVRMLGLRFDPALSLVGGEDTLFFDALLRAGAVFADAARARTFERVPANRATLEWLATRWRRTGVTDGLMVANHRGGGWVARWRAGFDGVLRCLLSGPLVAGAWLAAGTKPGILMARFLYTFQRGRGMIDFARGGLVEEYKR